MSFDGFQPLALEGAPQRIADEIRSAILEGSLPPGQQLTETQLADQFGVSRGPVREAMQRLIQEGLLRQSVNRGAFVMDFGPEDVRDIFLAREAIECAAATIVLRNARAEVSDALTSLVSEMGAAVRDHSWRRVVDADLGFHMVLVEGAGSKRLSRIFSTLVAETRLCIMAMEESYADWHDIIVEHEQLAAAIQHGSEADVRQLLNEHLISGRRQISRYGAS